MSQSESGLFDKQCKLEVEGINEGIKSYWAYQEKIKNDVNKDNASLTPESLLMNKMIKGTAMVIHHRLFKVTNRGGGSPDSRKAFNFFKNECSLGEIHLAFLVAHAAINVHPGEPIQATAVKVGRHVIQDQEYNDLLELAPAYLSKVEAGLKTSHIRHRTKVLEHVKVKVVIRDKDGNITHNGIDRIVADDILRYNLGIFLIDCLIEGSGCFIQKEIDRASNSNVKFEKSKFKGLVPISKAEEWLDKMHTQAAESHTSRWPMVYPPLDWKDVRGGGFLTQKLGLRTSLVNVRHTEHFLENAKKGNLDRVFKALNALQHTPFRVNKRLIPVVEWAAERGRGKLPNPDKEAILSKAIPKPWTTDEEFLDYKENHPEEFRNVMSSHAAAHDKWNRESAKRQVVLSQLYIINKFKDFERLYFCHNLDFRGRAYPMQQFFNPQIDDAGRAFLEFAEGKPLGEEGARVFMINLANNYGYDKDTYEGRIQWVKDHHDEILACADDPYSNSFWEYADKPFVFLAGCFEYAGFVAHGIDYVSHYICSADGTCSGVQHYTALLKDEVAAPKVNLSSKIDAKPADLYAIVAKRVNEKLQGILEGGSDEDKEMAKLWLEVGVERSECKRNSMTLCYGLSAQGFRKQIENHLFKMRGKQERFGIFNTEPGLIPTAGGWLGDRNNEALGDTLPRAKAAMAFIQKVAAFFGKHNMPLVWTTPIGLRVLQRYFKTKKKIVKSQVGGATLKITLQVDTDKQDSIRHRNGSAPNFIHSMDASHLMLTVLKCEETGGADGTPMSYAFIHDSFGCHACDLPVMQANLRKAMVEMYSGNILEKFVEELTGQVPDSLKEEWAKLLEENPMPTQGSFDINEVLDSPYLFN